MSRSVLAEEFRREGAGALAVRKSRSLHPNAEVDGRARRLVPSQKGIFDKTISKFSNENSERPTRHRVHGIGSPHGAQRKAGTAVPDCAPRHPGYGCAAATALLSIDVPPRPAVKLKHDKLSASLAVADGSRKVMTAKPSLTCVISS
jgi:hypothetical protein